MTEPRDADLEAAFLDLLRSMGPDLREQPGFTRAFARRLTDFAEAWANDSPNIDEYERSLAKWVESAVSARVIQDPAASSHSLPAELEQRVAALNSLSKLRVLSRMKMKRELKRLFDEQSRSAAAAGED